MSCRRTPKVIERCLLMTSDPGDPRLRSHLWFRHDGVLRGEMGAAGGLPPTPHGVPLALARQRLLTSTFDYFQLKESDRGPAGGLRVPAPAELEG